MSIEIKAGPELDAAVAKALGARPHECRGLTGSGGGVMECVNCKRSICCPPWSVSKADGLCGHGIDMQDSNIPHYSTDLNAALDAADKCGLFNVGIVPGTPYVNLSLEKTFGAWRVVYISANAPSRTFGYADTPALAICEAILTLGAVQ